MKRTECDELVDKVYVIWRIESTIQDRKKAKDVWWEFLHDLDLDAVRKVLNGKALVGSFPPRPGEVRVQTMLGRLPLMTDAWAELQDARERVSSGQFSEKPYSSITGAVIKRLGPQAMGLHTNGDRTTFATVFSRVLEEHVETQCQLLPLPN